MSRIVHPLLEESQEVQEHHIAEAPRVPTRKWLKASCQFRETLSCREPFWFKPFWLKIFAQDLYCSRAEIRFVALCFSLVCVCKTRTSEHVAARRSARLALQRERAESRPVEPVSIPLDDDTDSLIRGSAATCAVCGECSSANMVHIPCCDYAAHPGCVRNGVCPFCSSDASDAVGFVAVQPCVELDDELNIFSCCSSRRDLRCMAPRLSAVGEEVSCPDALLSPASADWFHRLCVINGVEWSADPELGDCVICTDRMTAVDSIEEPCCKQFAHVVCLARSFSSRGVIAPSAINPLRFLPGLPLSWLPHSSMVA